MRDGFKLEVPHDPGCFFIARDETPEFILYDDCVFNLRRNGARGGGTMWHRFECNSPIEGSRDGCAGRLLVRWDVLRDFLVAGQ